MLPRHGLAYSTLLLAHAAALTPRTSREEWLQAARAHGSFLASAINLDATADFLVVQGLASIERTVVLSPQMTELIELNDAVTLRDVARVLLAVAPPQWLNIAVSESRVDRIYIPADDLAGLLWLEPDLDDILVDVHTRLSAADQLPLRKKLGDAAELIVMAALEWVGHRPVHVAKISDSYGYDIEVRTRVGTTDRIEVKAAGPRTRESFHLSRNEFDKSRQHGGQWRLVQVVFSSAAFVASELDSSHVEAVLQLAPTALDQIVTPDSPAFVWEESALLTPPESAWFESAFELDPDFRLPGFASS